MEILFYVGMIIFGFYCLVNEDINDVRRDFGLEEITENVKKMELEQLLVLLHKVEEQSMHS